MDARAYFHGKKITVMGLGVLGRGVGDAAYLAECGAELIVTDLKTREELAESVAQLESFPNITFVLGEHRLEDFRGRDLILKAAGVPLDSPYIAEAKTQGIPVRMSADLFLEHSELRAIGVTGTRGKSTTTHMIAAILIEAGERVLLGGNVRGVSTLALLKEATSEHVAVLELDSWQCQGLGEANLSPHIAVFTTFYSDHRNYYQEDLGQYLADKANIFLYQDPDDTLVIGKQCAPMLIEAFGETIVAHTVIADESKLPNDWLLRIPGEHNRYDAALALVAARTWGVPDEVSRRALEAFPGVPGRLELLREVDGSKIYNDTNSTTPEATVAGLSALGENSTLIVGGSDKGLVLDALVVTIGARCANVIVLEHEKYTGSVALEEKFTKAGIRFESANSLEEALHRALSVADGGPILFSPAFASFGMFKNEYDRGDQFTALVAGL